MRKALVLLAVLGLVGAASADTITLFWSTTGISTTSPLLYSTALTNFQPVYQAPTPVPTDLNGWQVAPAGSYDLFLWGQFQPSWVGYQIYGLDLLWDAGSTATVGSNVAYRQRVGAWKRWDGTLPILLDGVMAAVTSAGIAWDGGANRLMDPNGMFLIGAAHVTLGIGEMLTINLDTRPGGVGKGIACRDADGAEVPDPIVIPARLCEIPEPLSILLVLTGMLLRRR
jgi:hypothetical protein